MGLEDYFRERIFWFEINLQFLHYYNFYKYIYLEENRPDFSEALENWT